MCSDKSNSLYMHFLWALLMEIKTVNKYFQLGDTLGVFRDLDRLYMSTLRRVVKPSVLCMNNNSCLRELDLKSSSLYLHQDMDVLSSFQQQLEACALAPELKDRISTCCFDFLKEVLVQFQMHLPASMEMLRKLEMFWPKLAMSTINRPGVKDLPAEFFSCSMDTLESHWRNIASVIRPLTPLGWKLRHLNQLLCSQVVVCLSATQVWKAARRKREGGKGALYVYNFVLF